MATDVQGIISAAQDTAQEMASQAADFTRKAQMAFDTRYEVGPMNLPLSLLDVEFNVSEAPTYQGEHFVAPPDPEPAPGLLPLPEFVVSTMPVNTTQKPVLRTPQVPAQLAHFNKQAPSVGGVSIPSAPAALQNLNLTLLELSDITVPGAPIGKR